MRTIAPLDEGPFSYARMGYANPDAVTQIANGVSTSTFTYDNNGNLAQKTTDGVITTYVPPATAKYFRFARVCTDRPAALN